MKLGAFDAVFHEAKQVGGTRYYLGLSAVLPKTGDCLPASFASICSKLGSSNSIIYLTPFVFPCIAMMILSGVIGRSLNQTPVALYRAFLMAAGVGAFVFSPAPLAE